MLDRKILVEKTKQYSAAESAAATICSQAIANNGQDIEQVTQNLHNLTVAMAKGYAFEVVINLISTMPDAE